jgi:hypothetical protein
VQLERPQVGKDDPVTIIYTSGTSGEGKGVVLTAANVGFMLDRTAERLEQLMSSSGPAGQDRIFHYLPFTFAASWIALLTFLEAAEPGHDQYGSGKDCERYEDRGSGLFSECAAVAGDECGGRWMNSCGRRAAWRRRFIRGPKAAWARRQEKQTKSGDALWLALANAAGIFPAIRKKMIGKNLKAADLRVGAAERGDAALFHDAGNSGAAGLRADGDDGDLHDGRSESG